jgi:subtilisin family serine protease
VVAVSTTDSNDALASFSSFGSWIDVAAPGTMILSTNNGGGYGYWQGTCFSAPLTAAAAALALAARPCPSNTDLVNLIRLGPD